MKRNHALLGLLILTMFFSCKKIIDPVIEKNTEAYLLNKAWKIEEITFVEDNVLFYYLRGGDNNTANFDYNTLIFKEDKSGVYTDGGYTYNITWKFNSEDKSKLEYTIYNYSKGAPLEGVNSVVYLENINVSDSYFKYAEIYSHDEQKSIISSVKRVYHSIE